MDLMENSINITFSELKQLKLADIQQCVSKDSALRITINSKVKRCEGEVLSLWIEKLFKVFEPEELSTEDLELLTEYFLTEIEQLLNDTFPTETSTKLNILSNCLTNLLNLLNWLHPLFQEFGLTKSSILLCFILLALNHFLKFYKKCSYKEQVGQYHAVHTALLNVIEDKSERIIPCAADEAENVTRIILHLCTITEYSSLLEIKTLVDTFKCITRLTLSCTKWLNIIDQSGTNAFKCLFREIARSIEYTFQHQSVVNVEKCLRISNFYITKLMQRLTIAYSHDNFPACEEYVRILDRLVSPKIVSLNPKASELLQYYVAQPITDLFQLIYRNDKISEILLGEIFETRNAAFYEITVKLLQVIIQKQDFNYIQNNIDFILQIFLRISGDFYIFTNPSNYNRFVEYYAAFYILCSACDYKIYKKFRQQLLKQLLDDNFMSATICCDVFSIAGKTLIGNKKNDYRNIFFWCKLSEKFSTLKSSNWYLIKAILQNISNKKDLTEVKLSSSFSEIMLFTLDENKLTTDAKSLKICEELVALLGNFESGNLSLHDYYKIILRLEYLSNKKSQLRKELLDISIRITQGIIQCDSDILKQHSSLVNALIEFISCNVKIFSSDVIFNLLKQISENTSNMQCFIGDLFVLLYKTKTLSPFEQISKKILEILQRDCQEKLLVKLLTLSFGNNNGSDDGNIVVVDEDNDYVPAKRKRGSGNKEVLKEIFEKVELLNTDGACDEEDLETVENIVKSLKYFVKKKKLL